MSNTIEAKLRYKQPYSIKVNTGNEALDYHLINKEHGYQKYQARRAYRERKTSTEKAS